MIGDQKGAGGDAEPDGEVSEQPRGHCMAMGRKVSASGNRMAPPNS